MRTYDNPYYTVGQQFVNDVGTHGVPMIFTSFCPTVLLAEQSKASTERDDEAAEEERSGKRNHEHQYAGEQHPA